MRTSQIALAALMAVGASASNIGLHSGHDMAKIHAAIDGDSDGKLSKAEIEKVLTVAYNKERSARAAKTAAEKQDEIDSAFDKMDANGDGKVTKAEAMPAGSEADNIQMSRRWVLADGDNNGTLSKAEAAVFLFPELSLNIDARAKYFAGESFPTLDANGDGKIDLEEFQAHMQGEVKKHAADNLESVFMDDTDPKHANILQEYLKVWFHKADADKSKSISHSELPAAFAFFEEEPDFAGEAESAIRLADTNKDNNIDTDEIKAAPTHVKDFLAAHGAAHGEL